MCSRLDGGVTCFLKDMGMAPSGRSAHDRIGYEDEDPYLEYSFIFHNRLPQCLGGDERIVITRY